MYISNDNALIEKYANELYSILLRIMTFYDKMFNPCDYLAYIEEYLNVDCYNANQEIGLFSALGKYIAGDADGSVNNFEFIIQKWLGLFSEVV